MSFDIDKPMIAVVRACSREFREVEESYRKKDFSIVQMRKVSS